MSFKDSPLYWSWSLFLVIQRALIAKQVKKEGTDATGRTGQLPARASKEAGNSELVLKGTQGPARQRRGRAGRPKVDTRQHRQGRGTQIPEEWGALRLREAKSPKSGASVGPGGRWGPLRGFAPGTEQSSWEGEAKSRGRGRHAGPREQGRTAKIAVVSGLVQWFLVWCKGLWLRF